MSALLVSRIDATKLYPPFLAAVMAMLDEALAQGASYWAVSGFRSYAEQTQLFDQGRTTPGKVVTRAKAGQSAHNFGIAVDLCRDGVLDRAGLQPDYKPESYELLATLAPRHGLVWGGSWRFRDNPHVQLPNYVNLPQLEPLREAYERAGLLAVFQYLDQPNAPAHPATAMAPAPR